jgi:hypothetical protein
MRCIALLALLLAGCGSGGGGNNNPHQAHPPAQAAVQTAALTGLYESGQGPQRSQLCMIERGAGGTRFGLVLRGAADASCSGAGTASRRGALVRLTMEGDQPCVVEARLEGGRLVFPASLPSGCAYYCGGSATMAGAAFAKVGGTEQDALRALDLVGDPLCG